MQLRLVTVTLCDVNVGQAEIAENLCASFFNEDLSNDTHFHLDLFRSAVPLKDIL